MTINNSGNEEYIYIRVCALQEREVACRVSVSPGKVTYFWDSFSHTHSCFCFVYVMSLRDKSDS